MTLNDLYELAYNHKIGVYSFKMSDSKAICIHMNGLHNIGMDYRKIKTISEEKTILAHEMGHCETGSFYCANNKLDVKGRHEYRANKWVFNNILKLTDIKKAFKNGYTTIWDLAEYFDVTEDMISKAIEYYKNQSLL